MLQAATTCLIMQNKSLSVTFNVTWTGTYVVDAVVIRNVRMIASTYVRLSNTPERNVV